MPTILVLNGPNLNLLGTREPAVYGSATLADVQALCEATGRQLGVDVDFRQSNHEGVLIDWLHEAGRLHQQGDLAGVVLNAGAFTHTSIALHDAIKGTGVPLIELHISNVFAREPFRHHSTISPVARAVICGLGVDGYPLAVQALARMRTALSETVIEGINTNVDLHRELLVDAKFVAGGTNIHYLEEWLAQRKR